MNWLTTLKKTPNFYAVANKTFRRILKGEQPALIIIRGGLPGKSPKCNKTLFLKLVESLPDNVDSYTYALPDFLTDIINQSEGEFYRCVNLRDDSNFAESVLYSIPLSVVATMAIANATTREGWELGRHMVLICDNLEKYMDIHSEENEYFLRNLAGALEGQTAITFIGATQMVWEAEKVLGAEYLVSLG